MTQLSPIVVFTFKRLDTLKVTIEALASNFLAPESDLIIYSDGAKLNEDVKTIEGVRHYLKQITGFKSLTIFESSYNKGLANSIIEGVSVVISKYGKAIVIEDDLITSRNFLSFMNAGLTQYVGTKKIYSISGYAFNLKTKSNVFDGYFLNRSMSWGWATWADRWAEVDWEVKDYDAFKVSKIQKKEFSKMGTDVNGMLKNQMTGVISSWYIRFVYHQFKIKGLTLFPTISKIENNGFDLFATHTKGLKRRYITPFDVSNKKNFILPSEIIIDKRNQKALQIKMSIFVRLINKVLEIVHL